jgi:hypothetical protein
MSKEFDEFMESVKALPDYPELEGTMNLCEDIIEKKTGKMTEEEWQAAERAQIVPKQETQSNTYNVGDIIRIICPYPGRPEVFMTHKVDNDYGVVYYYRLDGKEETIGFNYIEKERMYSEEEVIDFLQEMNDWPTTFEGRIDIREWFEQFKK